MNIEYIYHNYGDALFSICQRYCASHTEAEDVFHDGLLHIEAHLNQYKGKGSLEGWCKRLMVSTAVGRFRKIQKEQNSIEGFIEEQDGNKIVQPDFEEAQTEIFDADFSGEEIREAVQSLPVKCRNVFNLYVFEELKHKEIAKTLGISTGTSKSQLQRARKLLHKTLFNKAQKKKRKPVNASLIFVMTEPYNYIDKLAKNQISQIVDKAPLVDIAAISKGTVGATGKLSFLKATTGLKGLIVGGTIAVTTAVTVVILPDTPEQLEKIEFRKNPSLLHQKVEMNVPNESASFKVQFPENKNRKVVKHVVFYDTVEKPQRIKIMDTLK